MKEVTIFSSGWCSGCKVVKKALEVKGITFTEVDVTSVEGSKAASELNIRNIPVTFVGEGRFIGSSPEVIKYIIEEASVDEDNNTH